jgi:hypothetical protein
MILLKAVLTNEYVLFVNNYKQKYVIFLQRKALKITYPFFFIVQKNKVV